jgi:hypothetical protein
MTGTTVTMTGAGSCTITASQPGDLNWKPAIPVARSFTIAKRAVGVTADAGRTKVYGEADPLPFTFTVSAGSLVSGDAFVGVLSRVAGESAGAYAIAQGTLTLGSNYDLSFVGHDFTITPKAASVTPSAASKVYGSPDPAFSGTLTGFLAADGVTAAYSRAAGETVAGGPYPMGATLSPAGVLANYAITYNTANFTITKAPLTVTANDKTRAYGSPNPTLDASYSGFVNGQTPAVLGGSLACTTTATATSGVAGSPYPTTCSGLTSANYAITWGAGKLTVTKAPLTVTALDVTRLLGASTPAFGVTYAGFMNGETAAVLGGSLVVAPTAAVSATAPALYTLRSSGLTSSNYAITYVDGKLTTVYRICLLYDPTKPASGSTIPIKLYLCNTTGANLSKSAITLTAIQIDQGSTKVASASGSFTFNAKITSGGGYQYNVSTKGLVVGKGITYTLKFRVSTDVAGVFQYATFIIK